MDRDSPANPVAPYPGPGLCPMCAGHLVGQPCPADRVGQLLGGKYRVLSLLGVGGMGVVFAARHEVVGRRFAVKVLHPSLIGQVEYLQRFRAEAAAAGSLENENIAAVTDFGITGDGGAFLVMEFLEGEDLRALLDRERRLPIGRAVGIVIQACRGLAAAHARGIVHRDLKPENLFLCRHPDGRDLVKLLDFGIAKLQEPGLRTQTGVTLGTAHYMSPEQARGARDIDHRTDVHALGAVLYELISGRLAHPGSSYNEVLFHVHSQIPMPLAALCPDVPQGLSDVIDRALAERPEDRYDRVEALAESLAPYSGLHVTALPVEGKRPVSGPRSATPVTGPTAAWDLGSGARRAQPTPRLKESFLRRSGVWLGLGGLAAAGFWWWQGRPEPADDERTRTDRASLTGIENGTEEPEPTVTGVVAKAAPLAPEATADAGVPEASPEKATPPPKVRPRPATAGDRATQMRRTRPFSVSKARPIDSRTEPRRSPAKDAHGGLSETPPVLPESSGPRPKVEPAPEAPHPIRRSRL